MDTQNFCTVTEVNIDGIPVIFLRNSGQEPKPIIFLFHKLLNNKIKELSLAYVLASAGYFVVGIDMYGHGDREESFDKSRKYEFNNLFYDVYRTARDIPAIIEFLKEQKSLNLDFLNIGAVGVSIGGSIALVAGYLFKEIKFVTSIVGTCDWKYVLDNDLLSTFRFFAKSRKVMLLYDKVIRDIEEYEPINNYNFDNMIHILFLNGAMDTSMPLEAVKQYHKRFYELFSSKGKGEYLDFMVYPKAGHEVTAEMVKDLLEWLKKRAK